MATSGFVQLPDDTANTGKKEDHVVVSNGNYREVVSIGDPTTASGYAPVSATNGLAVDAKTLAPGAATEATLADLDSKVVAVDTGAVVVASSALPTGAATEAKQDTGNTSIAAVNTKLIQGVSLDFATGGGTQAVQIVGIALPASGGAVAGGTATNPLAINDAGGSITVDGSVTANAGTNLNTSLLALEAGGNLAAIKADTDKIPALGQALAAASVPVVLTAAQLTTLTPPAAITGFATETTLGTRLSESDFDTKTGSLTETAPTTDTASSGLNGRLQRIAQRLTSLITALGSPFQAGGSIGNTAFVANAGTNLNTSLLALESGGNLAAIKTDVDKIPSQGQALAAASMPVVLTAAQITTLTPPAAITGFATETTLGTRLSESDFDTKIGSLTETAPATDTASSGLNGRLQRIAQRLTTLITALGSPFQAGGSIGNTTFAVTQATGTNLHTVIDSGTVTPVPSTTGGWTNSKKAALSNTNSQVKSGAGTLGGWYIYNPNASVAYVQIYDTATGSITVGTTPAVLSIGIPATSAANLELTLGANFTTAICVAATTAAGNATAPGTALDCNFWYK